MSSKEKLKPEQKTAIKELEDLIGKPIPSVDEVNGDFIGLKIKNREIIELSLSKCGLTDLPSSFKNLKSLRVLFLLINQFKQIPEFLSKLDKLEILDLDGNQLSSLPDSFCNFKSLKILYLSHNKLKALPNCFGNLVSLQRLYLTNNLLDTLPVSIGNLKSLQRLSLQENKFTSVPKAIVELKSLKELILSGNQLTKLPNFLWRLKKLRRLMFYDNPWEDEWIELSKNTLQVLQNYWRKRDTISIFISHAWIDQDIYQVCNLEDYLEKQDEINEVFICEEDLVGDIQKFMNEKVPQSQLLIFIGTKNSIKSEDCLHELALAVNHRIEIVPIKGADLQWAALNKLSLTKDGKTLFDLGEKKGFEYDGEDFEGFCVQLYEYIRQFKQEINLYDPEKAQIDKEKINIKSVLLNFIESNQFHDFLVNNIERFEKLYDDLSNNLITPLDYYFKIGKIFSSSKK